MVHGVSLIFNIREQPDAVFSILHAFSPYTALWGINELFGVFLLISSDSLRHHELVVERWGVGQHCLSLPLLVWLSLMILLCHQACWDKLFLKAMGLLITNILVCFFSVPFCCNIQVFEVFIDIIYLIYKYLSGPLGPDPWPPSPDLTMLIIIFPGVSLLPFL